MREELPRSQYPSRETCSDVKRAFIRPFILSSYDAFEPKKRYVIIKLSLQQSNLEQNQNYNIEQTTLPSCNIPRYICTLIFFQLFVNRIFKIPTG